MSKKVLAVVGLAAVIALSTGVITYVGTQNQRGSDADIIASKATDQATEADPSDDLPTTAEETETPSAAPTQPSDTPEDNDSYGFGAELAAYGSYRITAVVDHTTGVESSPREVFGKYYAECYLAFSSDGRFRLYINPASGDLLTGSYQVYDDVISVRYDSGIGSEFNIWMKDNSTEIDCIIVNYGDYDVYFS